MVLNMSVLLKSVFLAVVALCLKGCSTFTFQNETNICRFETDPHIILDKGESILQYWDYETGYFDQRTDFKNLKFLKSYQKKIKSKVNDLDQKALWDRSYDLEKPGDQQNMRVAKTLHKSIRPINCLEALLLNLQGSRVDLVSEPTEFLAFVLKKNEQNRLLYFTSNVNGVRGLGFLHSKIEVFVKKGWALKQNIHNHILNLNDQNYRGTIGPSVSDAFVYKIELKDFNLAKAVITNGFDSMEVPSALFKELSTQY